MIDKKKLVVIDIETLKNCFIACCLDVKSGKRREFILFDDIQGLIDFAKFLNSLKSNDYTAITFNGINFDFQIIHYIEKNTKQWLDNENSIEEIITLIYEKAQEVITCPDDQRFFQLIPEQRFSIPQIDLFKQKHYDGKAKRGTSLKWIQFTSCFDNIEEMPIHHNSLITKEQIPFILSYCWNDVISTYEFYKKIEFETDLRLHLSEKYDINLLNASEPRIAKMVFAKFLCDEMGITYRELKDMRTYHTQIAIGNLIFPYIKFETSILQHLLETLKSTVLTPQQQFENVFKIHNIEVTFGLGGLHSNNQPKIWESNDEWVIETCDAVSMYPNLAIQNELKPKHLGDGFFKTYTNLYEQRKLIPKKDPVNYVYKICLNATYGLSSEVNSYLYDVAFTRAICINGELSLLMLAEAISIEIPEAQFIMLNTDGLEVYIPREKHKLYRKICKEWEKTTRLELEFNQYNKIVLSDVNNYICQDIKDKIKRKGKFSYSMNREDVELDYHKNPSFLVVPKALEQYFLYGKDYKQFINNHKNHFDFFAAVKKKSNFELNLYSINDGNIKIEPQQKITRFYVSKNGRKFYKDFNDKRRTSILADWEVEPLNKITEEGINEMFNNLNYPFYTKETEKIIREIEGNRSQLTLF